MREFAEDYIYYVYNFKNGTLFFSRFFSSLIYFYLFFIIAHFTRLKYLSLIPLFIKGLFIAVYIGILLCISAVGGVTVIIFVFLPSSLISLGMCFFVVEFGKIFGRFSAAVPAVLAFIDGLILLILVNVLLRVIIAIV